MKFASVEFELFVADFYKNKVEAVKKSGHEWKLSLVSVRNLLRTRKCPWTGLELTISTGQHRNPSDITIDRIDNNKGYVKGNVIAVSRAANNFKSIFENPQYPITLDQADKVVQRMRKKVNKTKGENK